MQPSLWAEPPPGIRIRVAHRDDAAKAAWVMNGVRGWNLPPERMIWRYWGRPSQGSLLLLEGDSPVGVCGACSVDLSFGGKTAKSWVVVDDGVLPTHRGRGICRALGQALVTMLKEMQGLPVWGFASAMPRHAHTADFGMQEVCYFPWFWLPAGHLVGLFAAKVHVRRPSTQALTVCGARDTTKVDQSRMAEAFSQSLRDATAIHVHKDEAYLQWRYLSHPNHEYGLPRSSDWSAVMVLRGRAIVDFAYVGTSAIVDLFRLLHKHRPLPDYYLYYCGRGPTLGVLRQVGAYSWTSPLARWVETTRVRKPHYLIAADLSEELHLLLWDPARWELAEGDV